jgi:RNA polymerase sigma-70 factor (sigma-E family)
MRPEIEKEYVEYVSARLSRLHRTAYLLCGDGDRADDIVQSTMTALYLHWRRARAADNLDAYVHRMLVRRFIDERRLSWSRVHLTSTTLDWAAPGGHDVEERDAVTSALGQLSRSRRAVLVLRYFCDLSIADTAAVLHCSEGNVKSQTSRGLSALRRLLEARGAAEPRADNRGSAGTGGAAGARDPDPRHPIGQDSYEIGVAP